MSKAELLIAEAQKWVGYLEKKSNKSLNSFTANAGNKNYTRFAVDYCNYFGESKKVFQAQPWCAMFVSVMFANVFCAEFAEKLLGGHYAYCPYGVNHFKSIGIWKTSHPKPGDVIMFRNASGVACHTGIVTAVDNRRVYTIEGNTSSASGVIANGGCVAKKSYSLSYSKIMGYGDINYNLYNISLFFIFTKQPLIAIINRKCSQRHCNQNRKHCDCQNKITTRKSHCKRY